MADLPEAREFRARVALASARTWRPQSSPAVRSDAAINHRAGMSWSLFTSRSYDLAPGQTLVRNFAWWGGDVMDLRSVMGPGVVVVLELHAVMGGHTIHVPRGVRVLDESNRLLMSTNDVEPAAQGDGSNGTLVLRGTQILSGSAVQAGRATQALTRNRVPAAGHGGGGSRGPPRPAVDSRPGPPRPRPSWRDGR